MNQRTREATHYLPAETSSFIGRASELARVQTLLSETRLLTLTGPGGCGKTRLALRVATEITAGFDDGVYWIELSSLMDEALVAHRVARGLEVREAAGRSILELLVDRLRPAAALLVLDNCEHVIGECAMLIETLLLGCPRLKILATSREALHLSGEIAWNVPSLDTPDRAQHIDAQSIMRYESGRLFVERASAASSTFALTSTAATTIADICTRLDGMPLAIELAAACTRSLSVGQIDARLSDRFHLLTGGSRVAEPRQQSLQAMMDWSYELLSERERQVFRRLSVFSGGFTLQAAEEICSDSEMEWPEIFEPLSRLIDKSLVQTQLREGEARYHLLETVRQYAHEKQLRTEDAARVSERHARYFLQLAESIEPKLRSGEQQIWLEQLEVEHDNLREALGWARDAESSGEILLRLAGTLWWFWWRRGYFAEGNAWLRQALAGPSSSTGLGLAAALHGSGWLARHLGEYDVAEQQLSQSLELYRQLGDTWGQSVVLHRLGAVILDRGDLDRAARLINHSLEIARQNDDPWVAGTARYWSGLVAHYRGEYGRAREEIEVGLALLRKSGDRWAIDRALGFLGSVARRSNDLKRAETLLNEALGESQAAGDRWGTAYWIYDLGLLWIASGNADAASTLFNDALVRFRDIGDSYRIAACLDGLALVAELQGDAHQVAKLSGAAEQLLTTIGAARSPADRVQVESAMIAARKKLGDAVFEQDFASGATTPWKQLITHVGRASIANRVLTPRESEILQLVAEGLTDPQIAERIYLSPRTVSHHLGNIYRKLEVSSRTAAVLKAAELDLI